MSSLIGTSADWYLMRASGFVAFALLTATVCLGIANLARAGKRPSTRALVTLVHRNASLLSVVFLVLHIVTAISDHYVNIPALAIVVPGKSGYDPLWIGLGAVGVDLLLAVMVTSLLRARLRYRSWQLVHWLSYLSWPTALAHSIGSGSGAGIDTGALWSTVIYVVCGAAFAAAVAVRLLRRQPPATPLGPGRRPPSYAAPRRPAAYAAPRRPAAHAGSSQPPAPAAALPAAPAPTPTTPRRSL